MHVAKLLHATTEHIMESMPNPTDESSEALEELALQAVSVAAADLGLNPHAFAQELAQGEIGLLISYLRRALPEVRDLKLQEEIAALLHRLTAWTGAEP
jgi:hypothetical protein